MIQDVIKVDYFQGKLFHQLNNKCKIYIMSFLKFRYSEKAKTIWKKSPCCQRFYLKHLILKSYILKIIDLYRQERLFHFQISWGRTRRTFRHRTFLSGRRTITLLFVLAVSMKIYNTYTRKLSNILVAKVLHTKVNKHELNWLLARQKMWTILVPTKFKEILRIWFRV